MWNQVREVASYLRVEVRALSLAVLSVTMCTELCGQILCLFTSLIAGPLLGLQKEPTGHARSFPIPISPLVLLSFMWGLQDLQCFLAAPRLSAAKEAKANFFFGSIYVCGRVEESWGILAPLSECGNWMPRKDKLCLQTESSGDVFIWTDKNKCYLEAYDLYNIGHSSGQTPFAKLETSFCFYCEETQSLSVSLGCWCNSLSSPRWFFFQ